ANVIGSLHSSGLITLIDAAGLAAIIAAGPAEMDGVIPLGSAATLRFLAPARGRLTATCALDAHARDQLTALFARATAKIKIKTMADVRDERGALVCEGSFQWSVRRIIRPSATASDRGRRVWAVGEIERERFRAR